MLTEQYENGSHHGSIDPATYSSLHNARHDPCTLEKETVVAQRPARAHRLHLVNGSNVLVIFMARNCLDVFRSQVRCSQGSSRPNFSIVRTGRSIPWRVEAHNQASLNNIFHLLVKHFQFWVTLNWPSQNKQLVSTKSRKGSEWTCMFGRTVEMDKYRNMNELAPFFDDKDMICKVARTHAHMPSAAQSKHAPIARSSKMLGCGTRDPCLPPKEWPP